MGKISETIQRQFDEFGNVLEENKSTVYSNHTVCSEYRRHLPFGAEVEFAGVTDVPEPSARQRVVTAVCNALDPEELLPLVMDWLRETKE